MHLFAEEVVLTAVNLLHVLLFTTKLSLPRQIYHRVYSGFYDEKMVITMVKGGGGAIDVFLSN